MSNFKVKMHQILFRLGLRPRPRWGAYSAPPDPLARFKGPTSKGGEGKGGNERGKGGVEERGDGRGGEKKGKGEGKGEGKEGTPKVWLTPPMFEILKNTLSRCHVRSLLR